MSSALSIYVAANRAPSAASTAANASALFRVVMVGRYGSKWRLDIDQDTIASLASEIATGFGGKRLTGADVHRYGHPSSLARFRFPDGSAAEAGPQGLQGLHPSDPEAALTHDNEVAPELRAIAS